MTAQVKIANVSQALLLAAVIFIVVAAVSVGVTTACITEYGEPTLMMLQSIFKAQPDALFGALCDVFLDVLLLLLAASAGMWLFGAPACILALMLRFFIFSFTCASVIKFYSFAGGLPVIYIILISLPLLISQCALSMRGLREWGIHIKCTVYKKSSRTIFEQEAMKAEDMRRTLLCAAAVTFEMVGTRLIPSLFNGIGSVI